MNDKNRRETTQTVTACRDLYEELKIIIAYLAAEAKGEVYILDFV